MVEEELEEWQEVLYQMGLGEGTENIDEGVRKLALKALNKMREGLQKQGEGIVKQEEGLAEIIQVVTNTPIRSLGPVFELLASARPFSSSQGAPPADTPCGSACPPAPEFSTTPACPSSSTYTSTSVDPPIPACPVTPLEAPIVSSPEGLSADSPQWRPIRMYVGGKCKYMCPDQNCGHVMSTINMVKGHIRKTHTNETCGPCPNMPIHMQQC